MIECASSVTSPGEPETHDLCHLHICNTLVMASFQIIRVFAKWTSNEMSICGRLESAARAARYVIIVGLSLLLIFQHRLHRQELSFGVYLYALTTLQIST